MCGEDIFEVDSDVFEGDERKTRVVVALVSPYGLYLSV